MNTTVVKNIGFGIVFFVALGLFGVMVGSFAGLDLFGTGGTDDPRSRGFAPSSGDIK